MAEIVDIESARLKFGPKPMPEWEAMLMTNVDGSKKGNLANCMVVFRHAPPFAGKIGKDVRSLRLVATAETPAGPAGPWTDDYTTAACDWIQRAHIPVKLSDVAHAVQSVANTVAVDELGDWLRALPEKWDGTERLGSWLHYYCGAEHTDLTSMIGSKFLIGAVARALQPGCRMDYMLVLEGLQGIGKSTVVKILGGEYTGENLPDFSSRDSMQIAGNKWFLEVGELAAIQRSHLDEVKSFLTRTEDTYVPKYGRHPVTIKRCSVLIGNINPDERGYLMDATGNRRFWPVAVGEMNLEALRQEREQRIAEAAYCYQRGDPWWIENGEQQIIFTEAQQLRLEHDEWEAIVGRYIFETVTVDFQGVRTWVKRVQPLARTTILDVATNAIGMQPKEINKSVQTRLGIALKKNDFTKRKVSEDGLRFWAFFPPKAE